MRGTTSRFTSFVKQGAPPVPQHYPILKKINAKGPELLGAAPTVLGLPPDEFQKALTEGGSQLVDTRQMLAFGGGHIPGAINIGGRPEMSVWAGDMLAHDKPILLVVDDETQLDWVAWRFAYVGLTNFAGYLAGGMKAWDNRGLPLTTLPQVSVQQLAQERARFQFLDVRSTSEFEKGRIAGAKHKFVAEMREGVNGDVDLDPNEPIAVYCGSGYRASIAASLMQRDGFKAVYNVPGSIQAWKNAGFKLEN